MNNLIVLAVQLNGNKMNYNTLDKKSFLIQLTSIVKSNIKNIIIFLSVCFAFFVIYQFYSFYSSSKIKNNSVVFFNNQNIGDENFINETILKLSKEKGFYGVLSNLELIKKHLQNQNYEDLKNIYNLLLSNKKLDNTYKSAIATKASYEFIDINFLSSSNDYSETIKNFISLIDDELINYQGTKLELNYLVAILSAKKNNLNYLNNTEAIYLYDNIMSSNIASSSIKDRVNKIHEYYTYK